MMRTPNCSQAPTPGRRWRGGRAANAVARVPTPMLLALTLACSGEHELAPPPPVPDRELYWALDLNHHAVLMSSANPLYDTLTLVATPRNRYGEALAGLGAPQFSSPNPEQLAVSPEGQLIALEPTSEPLPVVATLTAGNLKHVDTVYVSVVNEPEPPVLTEFSAHPVAPDSAKLAAEVGGSVFSLVRVNLPVRATDANGAAMAGLPVSVRSSDPLVLKITAPLNGQIVGVRPGTAMVYASVTAFGVTKVDTVPYRIGWPVSTGVSLEKQEGGWVFQPSDITIGAGAMLAFGGAADTLDVIFNDNDLPNIVSAPTFGGWEIIAGSLDWGDFPASFLITAVCSIYDCNAGNITAPLPQNESSSIAAFRVFTAPGIYEYHSTRYGATGRIIVVDEH